MVKSVERRGSHSGTVQKLLKIAQMRCDETRNALASIRVAQASTETAFAQLDHSLITEQRRAERDGSDPAAEILSRYMEKVRHKRANMVATLAQLEARENTLKDELTEAHVEVRKFERLIELTERREKKARDQRLQRTSDDLVTARYGLNRNI